MTLRLNHRHVITLEQGKDFHVIPSDGSIIAVKVTDQQRVTTDLGIFPG